MTTTTAVPQETTNGGNGLIATKKGKLTLRGSMKSWCTLRVLTMLYEKGIEDFDYIPVDFRSFEHKKAPYLAIQPFGQVPVLQDGDFTLYESRAICKYLEMKFGSHDGGSSDRKGEGEALMPTLEKDGLQSVALFEQALSVEASNFDELAGSLVHEIWLVPIITQKPKDEAAVASLRSQLSKKMDALDGILAKSPYFFGEKFSLADLFYMPLVTSLFDVQQGDLITARAGWKAWWNRVSERPAWKKAVGEYNAAMRAK